MADRDESRDIAVYSAPLAQHHIPWCPEANSPKWIHYVPHSDLEAAEKEIASLRCKLELRDREVANLTEDLRHIRTSLEVAEQSIRDAVGRAYPF